MLDSINDVLINSWERSKKYGVNPTEAKEAILQEYELRQYQEQKDVLLKMIYPIIEQLAYSLKSSGSVVTVSSTSGILLNTMGDPVFLQEAEKIYLQSGACWSEEVRGTNSAGTVTIEKKPLAIVGREHYLQQHDFLFCAGSPIFDSLGNLEAVLNISGHCDLYNPSILGMIDILTRNIENWQLIRRTRPQMVISLHPQQKRFEALLAIDSHGQIIGSNREARHLCQIENLSNKAVYLEEVFENTAHLLQSEQSFTTSSTIPLQMKDKVDDIFFGSVIVNSFTHGVSFTKSKSSGKSVSSKKRKSASFTFSDIYGHDPILQNALTKAKRAATTNYTVVINGESGTGKEMVSQSIHQESPRADKPFIALNCGSIPKNLAESHLFGYEAGAFTGAKQVGQPGVFEQADGGTLFLDEIAELPMEVQISLLRILQDFKVTRIGGNKPIQVDVRLITATHTNLWHKVQEGSFRADLFYRLQGIQIELPPLRERQDRLQLANRLLKEIKMELQKPSLTFSPAAEQLIENYSWPGNIRQLSGALREAAFTAMSHIIDIDCLPSYIVESFLAFKSSGSLLQDNENQLILETMRKVEGNISEAARILGIGRNTLYRKLNNLPR